MHNSPKKSKAKDKFLCFGWYVILYFNIEVQIRAHKYGENLFKKNYKYAVPYWQEVKNLGTHIFSQPKPSHTQRPPPLGIKLGIHVFM